METSCEPLQVMSDRGHFIRSYDQVEALIGRLAPEPICDPCIVERLALNSLHQASQRTRELAGTRGFERLQHACATCGVTRSVIRRKVA